MNRRRNNKKRGRGNRGNRRRFEEEKKEWIPRSDLGKKVKAGEIDSIDKLLDEGIKITEPEIVDKLLPEIEIDFLNVGQSKGKFGGGKRKIYKHTQKKVREGARIKFAFLAVVGDKKGYVGVGYGTSRKSNSAREISVKNAKLNLTRVNRGCGSWECTCGENHSIPFTVIGKQGSVRVTLRPAPRGTGLVANDEVKKILQLAGISDVWTESSGETRTRVNGLRAVYDALRNINMFRR